MDTLKDLILLSSISWNASATLCRNNLLSKNGWS
jgi:hypothetical protein